MNNSMAAGGRTRMLVRIGYVLAAAVGLKYGYDFGDRLAGMPFGVLVALNAGIFAALMFGVVAGPLLRAAERNRDKPRA